MISFQSVQRNKSICFDRKLVENVAKMYSQQSIQFFYCVTR
jgi:hypothetical protein